MALAKQDPPRRAGAPSGPLAITAARVVQASLREDASVDELVKLAQLDPAFALRLLRVVNSSAYGLKHRIVDMKQAASLLGVRGLRNVGLSLAVTSMAPPGRDAGLLLANCLRRAVAAKQIADKLRIAHKDELFTIGLFLEIGLLVQASRDLRGATAIARAPAAYRCVYERVDGLEPHPARAVEIARNYQLPEIALAAIGSHHDPKPPEEITARIAWAAERVAAIFEGGDVATLRRDALQALSAARVPLREAERLIAELPQMVTSAAQGFDREIGPQQDVQSLSADAHRALVALNQDYGRLVDRLEQLIAEKDQLTEQLRVANARLTDLAATDELTGLPNKRAFHDALAREVARVLRHSTALALVIVDVDHFKFVNDTWGHPAGDAVLRSVGQVLKAGLRTGDMAARFGGEEFVLLLPEADVAGGTVVAERLRRSLEELVTHFDGHDLKVTASFGVAEATRSSTVEELVGRADTALYNAKRAGRNRVVCAQEEPLTLTEGLRMTGKRMGGVG